MSPPGRTATVAIPYKPNPKQFSFHSLKAKYRAFCGGWGNGKTSGGCAEFITRLLEFPGTNSIVARKTRPELKATTWDMLVNGDTQETGWRGIPKELIRVNNRSELYIELFNGSKIHGLPLDDPKKIENYNLGLFMIDQAEEVEEDIFLKFHGRLRQINAPREGLLLFNPNGHNWLWKRFIDPGRRSGWKTTYKCVEATPFDNPNLPEDYLEQFDGLPDHWYQRFVLGSHEVFVGQIFTDFDPDTHVIQPFRIPTDWERWRCIDPGIRHEGCVSWIARDYAGNCYYYRELLAANQPVEWWASMIYELEGEEDIGGPEEEIYRSLIGPEAKQRAQTDGRSVYELFSDFGITPEFSDKDPVARISRITEYLRPRITEVPLDTPTIGRRVGPTTPTTEELAPRLYFFQDCTVPQSDSSPARGEDGYECKILEYLPQYRWRPQRTNFTEEDAPEAPRKKDDHNIDCLGHILVAMDDLPEVEGHPPVKTREEQFVEEHFAQAMEEAASRRPVTFRPKEAA